MNELPPRSFRPLLDHLRLFIATNREGKSFPKKDMQRKSSGTTERPLRGVRDEAIETKTFVIEIIRKPV
jgi:hypothetical protein